MLGSVFRFWGPPRFAGFLDFSLWFSVFVNNNGGFSFFFFSPVFSCFAKEVTPYSRAKTGQLFQGTIYIAFYPFF